MKSRWMIYGVTGYSGKLLAIEAVRQGLAPVIASRKEEQTICLAQELGLPYKIFDLDNPHEIAKNLTDIELIINCAGPYSKTAAQTMQACTMSKTHYLDITGEIEVFEYGMKNSEAFKNANIVVCSGTGFDVVPTDLVAAALKDNLPDADYLALAFNSMESPDLSRGTALTSLESIRNGCFIRENGSLKKVPFASKKIKANYSSGACLSSLIPWGDVGSAYHTTKIPNIETYTAVSGIQHIGMQFIQAFAPLLKQDKIYEYIEKKINTIQGPGERERDDFKFYVWAMAKNKKGITKTATLTTPTGYKTTMITPLVIAEKILTQPEKYIGGFYTPSQIISWKDSESIPGFSKIDIK